MVKNLNEDFKRFYNDYFLDYWELKYKFLKDRIESYNECEEILGDVKGIDTIPNYKKKFLTYLKFEVHFLKFQIIETLFSFIFALEKGDDLDLWFNLSFPRNINERSFGVYDKISEFKNPWKLEEYLEKKVKLNENLIPYWKYVFFFDKDLSPCGVEVEIIENNIITLLRQMAQTFADREDYNAYKHALRCFSTSLSVSISPHNTNRLIPVGFAKNGMNFLTKIKKEDDIIINSTFKAFSPKEDLYYIQEAMKLLKNIINVRKPYFCNEESDEIYYCEEEKKDYYISDDYTIQRSSRSTTSLNTILRQADHHYQQNNIDTAIVFFEKALQIDNTNESAILGLGYCYFKLKSFDESIKYFKRYTKNNRAEYWKRAQFKLALCYYSKNDLELTEIELTKLTSVFPNDTDSILTYARYLLADIKLRLNQQYFEESGRNEVKYVKASSKLLKKAEKNNFEHPEIWFKLALVQSYLGHFEQAKEIYEKINLHFPNDLSTKLNLAQLLIDFEPDLVYAEELLQECLELDKEYFNPWVGISIIKQKQGNMEDCFEACKKALELSKNLEEKKIAINNMGKYYLNSGNFKKAIEYFRNSLEIDKTFDDSIGDYIQCLMNLKKYEKIEEFTKDLEYNKKNKYHLKVRGYAFSHMDRHKEALELIDKSIGIFTDDLKFLSDLYDSKGDFLIRSGNDIQALEYFQKSLDTGIEEYEFTSKTKEKIKKFKSKLT